MYMKRKAKIKKRWFAVAGILCLFVVSGVNAIYSMAMENLETINYVYDKTGRLTSITYEDGTVVSYIYDAAGNVITVNAKKHDKKDTEKTTEASKTTEAKTTEADKNTEAKTTESKTEKKDLDQKAISKLKKTKAKIKKVKRAKKGKVTMTVGKIKNAIGYEVQYDTDKNFKKPKKKTFQKTSKTLTLKSGETYFVKVRGYYIDSKGKKIYTKYSKVKKVKTK